MSVWGIIVIVILTILAFSPSRASATRLTGDPDVPYREDE